MVPDLTGADNSIELRMGKISPAASDICVPQSLAAACRLNRYDNSPEGWGVKCGCWKCFITLTLRKRPGVPITGNSTAYSITFSELQQRKYQLNKVLAIYEAIPFTNSTRMWNMISSPATPTVCLEQKSGNFQSRNVTLSMPSQCKK